MKRVILPIAGIATALLVLALFNTNVPLPGRSIVHAQGVATATSRPVSDNEVNQISRNLYCPVCPNTPLEVCETAACARWREEVRDLLAQGKTEAQIRQYFIERFGVRTVGTPTDPTSQLLNIVLPFSLIGLIGIGIAFSLRRWRSNKRSKPDRDIIRNSEVSPDDYRARLEAELEERD